jgi:hypothetical protein
MLLEESEGAGIGLVGRGFVVMLAADPREGVLVIRIIMQRDQRIAVEGGMDFLLDRRRSEFVLAGDMERQRLADRGGLAGQRVQPDAVIAD